MMALAGWLMSRKSSGRMEWFYSGALFIAGLLATFSTPLPNGQSFTVTDGKFVPINL